MKISFQKVLTFFAENSQGKHNLQLEYNTLRNITDSNICEIQNLGIKTDFFFHNHIISKWNDSQMSCNLLLPLIWEVITKRFNLQISPQMGSHFKQQNPIQYYLFYSSIFVHIFVTAVPDGLTYSSLRLHSQFSHDI